MRTSVYTILLTLPACIERVDEHRHVPIALNAIPARLRLDSDLLIPRN